MPYDSTLFPDAPFFRTVHGELFGDTWEWDGTDWIQKTPATSPPPRECHAMAYDSTRERVVLFGGTDGSGFLGDTWEWDGTDWIQKTPATSARSSKRHTA